MENSQIIDKIRKGDLKAFEKVFRDNYEQLCDYAFRFTKDEDLAEELVQDIFYRIWKKHEQLMITSTLEGYLFQSVKNHCLQYFKHKAVELKYAEKVKMETQTLAYEPFEELENKELNDKIESTLRSLPDKCREIFMMSRFDGLKYQEIADKMAISVKTVEANMGKALKIFRESLGKYVGSFSG
jgi:RNA polymerase sigma-70 factor, ECF subfamily